MPWKESDNVGAVFEVAGGDVATAQLKPVLCAHVVEGGRRPS